MLDRVGAFVAVASASSATVFLGLVVAGVMDGSVHGGGAWIAGATAFAAPAWAGAWAWRAHRFELAALGILVGAFGSAWLGLAALVPVALAFVAGARAVGAHLAAPRR